MKKVPLKQAPDQDALTPATAPASTAVPEVLEILLLGGLWWFMLIQLPLMQQPAQAFPQSALVLLVKVQGVASAAIAVVLWGVRISSARQQWPHPLRMSALLMAIAILGAIMAWQGLEQLARGELFFYCAALQAILALGYFLAQRHGPEVP